MLTVNPVVAKDAYPYDAVVLRTYYSDLYAALATYEIDDIPFNSPRVKVRSNDSLLKIAKRNPLEKLDSFHFAAAIYEANRQVFSDSDVAQLTVGETLRLPTVGDIFYAQDRYERLKVVGDNLVFTSEDNQMQLGLRQPFDDAGALIGPLAVNEPLRHKEFTPPGTRQADMPNAGIKVGDGFVSVAPVSDAKVDAAEAVSVKKQASVIARDANAVAETELKLEDNVYFIDGSYLGPPRKSGAPSSENYTSDPVSAIVEWQFDSIATLGVVLNRLAQFIGYELITDNEVILNTYTRRLPSLQLRVDGITAEDGFQMLAGRGLETVYDHLTRTVKHVPKTNAVSKATPTISVASEGDRRPHEKLVQASGIGSMLRQFPLEIMSAAEHHASRCNSTVPASNPDAVRLSKSVVEKLQQRSSKTSVASLAAWYESPTGQAVLNLDNQVIEDEDLLQFVRDDARAERIERIYNNTVTGKGIAKISVALNHAGWTLSGCRQHVEGSGDLSSLNEELARGARIKKKFVKLESLQREDMLQSLAYQLSSLQERQLTEYANVITEHAGVYADLQQSVLDAIELETGLTNSSTKD